MTSGPPAIRSVLFFDGVCALCHRSIAVLVGLDRKGVIAVAPPQGETFRTAQPVIDLPQALGIQPVDPPLRIHADRGESCLAQHPKLLRDGGLVHLHALHELPDGPLAAA